MELSPPNHARSLPAASFESYLTQPFCLTLRVHIASWFQARPIEVQTKRSLRSNRASPIRARLSGIATIVALRSTPQQRQQKRRDCDEREQLKRTPVPLIRSAISVVGGRTAIAAVKSIRADTKQPPPPSGRLNSSKREQGTPSTRTPNRQQKPRSSGNAPSTSPRD